MSNWKGKRRFYKSRDTFLGERRRGDGEKVKIAQRLRRETMMTLAWVAERLRMGTKTYLTHLLYWDKRDKGK